jgi:uncharacterized Fe-S cluster-containing radical SAM superfamily protein
MKMTDGMAEGSAQGRGGMRQHLVDLQDQKVLIARLDNSLESSDSYTRINCGGHGRVRVFDKFSIHLRHPASRLPARPHFRGLPRKVPYRTQVFQVGGCNWNCWYCFVDDELLVGDSARGSFLSAKELVDLYLAEDEPAPVIDLSGGQPDLVPEWCLWVMRELEARGLRESVFVWIDDNLSGRFIRRFLSKDEISYMAKYPHHSRIGCFKGFDEKSFVFNTKAPISGFGRQFAVMEDLVADGFEMYAYATFTSPSAEGLDAGMNDFVNRLQRIHRNLPLRTIPLEIRPYSATLSRGVRNLDPLLAQQYLAAQAWESELMDRYSAEELATPYEDVVLS